LALLHLKVFVQLLLYGFGAWRLGKLGLACILAVVDKIARVGDFVDFAVPPPPVCVQWPFVSLVFDGMGISMVGLISGKMTFFALSVGLFRFHDCR
jgi:hypothetical protein